MVEGDRLRYIPIGVEDFKELRNGDYYFIDKSELISDILSDGSEVFLFTRPRRFGKSLNLSMLDAFFNMNYKGNTWFDGLKVLDHAEVGKHRNAYPVINICMKDIPVKNYSIFLSKIRSIIDMTYGQFPEIRGCDGIPEFMRRKYIDITPDQFDEVGLQESILMLCKMIGITYGVKPIVLIDEYDNPINNSFNVLSTRCLKMFKA